MSSAIDLTGQRFGKLTAIEDVGSKNNRRVWKCKCECGGIIHTITNLLTSGQTKSCGCIKNQCNQKLDDITNKKFNMLTVIKQIIKTKSKQRWWKCVCDCGNFIESTTKDLNSGRKKSCGCLKYTSCLKHGKKNSPEYSAWKAMKARYNNPKNPNYKNYGKRGITICKEWNESFIKFYENMGDRPSSSYSLGRIDNNKGYYNKNCRWETREQQLNNKRTNRLITYNNKTLTLTQWANRKNINPTTLYYRIYRFKWPISKALNT